jgi:CMP-N,N'-diacetyllegionaminic acid synthase
MIGNRSVLVVIPARQGSKGLPGKNEMTLCGRTLIEWAAVKALKSDYADKVVLSTDSLSMVRAAHLLGVDAPFVRPSYLSTDSASSVDVALHALDHYQLAQEIDFDFICLLEPTSPLREDHDLDFMLETIHARFDQFDAIVSVGRSHLSPSALKRLSGDYLERYSTAIPEASRRQDDAEAYFPYGIAYIIKSRTLRSQRTFYPDRTTWYEIQRYQQYEIDDEYDFLCVERVMQFQWGLM